MLKSLIGASKTKAISVIDLTKKISTDIISKNASECKAVNSNLQSFTVPSISTRGGCGITIAGVSQTIKATQNFTCKQTNENKSLIQNEFSEKLKNEVLAKTSGLQLSFNDVETEAITKLTTEIGNKINLSNISECVAVAINNQRINGSPIIADCTGMDKDDPLREVTVKNIEQNIVSSQVAECIQKNSNASEAINKLQTMIDNKASSENEGIGFGFGSLFIIGAVIIGGLVMVKFGTGMLPPRAKLFIGIIILIIILYLVYSIISAVKESFTSAEEQKIKFLQNTGKLSPVANENQKKMALRIY